MASELLHLQKKNWTGLRLGLIEELEAHLHPQAQMQIIEALKAEENIQLILTTHSPNLASKLKLQELIICNGKNAFPMGEEYTKLDSKSYRYLEKFLDTTKANLFFAKGIILVEGWAEEILLPSIAKAMGINLTEKGVSIVNIGNIGFSHYANIYLRKEKPHMDIPVAIITDADIKAYRKEKGSYIKEKTNVFSQETNKKIKSNNEKSEENVKYYTGAHWTLEYALYCSSLLGEKFKAACKNKHSRTDWDTNFEETLAEKLIDKTLKKTDIAYELALQIDNAVQDESFKISTEVNDDSISYLIQAIKYATKY